MSERLLRPTVAPRRALIVLACARRARENPQRGALGAAFGRDGSEPSLPAGSDRVLWPRPRLTTPRCRGGQPARAATLATPRAEHARSIGHAPAPSLRSPDPGRARGDRPGAHRPAPPAIVVGAGVAGPRSWRFGRPRCRKTNVRRIAAAPATPARTQSARSRLSTTGRRRSADMWLERVPRALGRAPRTPPHLLEKPPVPALARGQAHPPRVEYTNPPRPGRVKERRPRASTGLGRLRSAARRHRPSAVGGGEMVGGLVARAAPPTPKRSASGSARRRRGRCQIDSRNELAKRSWRGETYPEGGPR